METLILHHYDLSPFAEKIRLILGLKGLQWRSVVIPAVLPKPDYVALTGGYRRTPALQIGADVYCDTHLIAAVLEARSPAPSLFPQGREGPSMALVQWAEKLLFWPCARTTVGANEEHLPPGFHADRAAMRGLPAPDALRTRQAGEEARAQLQAMWPIVENLIGEATPFLTGAQPGLADFTLYHCLWFMEQLPRRMLSVLGASSALRDWMARIAAIGHGHREEMSASDALAVARAAGEAVAGLPDRHPAPPAKLVAVEPEERTSPPVSGVLHALNEEVVTLAREDPRAGQVRVHFPRLGYRILERAP